METQTATVNVDRPGTGVLLLQVSVDGVVVPKESSAKLGEQTVHVSQNVRTKHVRFNGGRTKTKGSVTTISFPESLFRPRAVYECRFAMRARTPRHPLFQRQLLAPTSAAVTVTPPSESVQLQLQVGGDTLPVYTSGVDPLTNVQQYHFRFHVSPAVGGGGGAASYVQLKVGPLTTRHSLELLVLLPPSASVHFEFVTVPSCPDTLADASSGGRLVSMFADARRPLFVIMPDPRQLPQWLRLREQLQERRIRARRPLLEDADIRTMCLRALGGEEGGGGAVRAIGATNGTVDGVSALLALGLCNHAAQQTEQQHHGVTLLLVAPPHDVQFAEDFECRVQGICKYTLSLHEVDVLVWSEVSSPGSCSPPDPVLTAPLRTSARVQPVFRPLFPGHALLSLVGETGLVAVSLSVPACGALARELREALLSRSSGTDDSNQHLLPAAVQKVAEKSRFASAVAICNPPLLTTTKGAACSLSRKNRNLTVTVVIVAESHDVVSASSLAAVVGALRRQTYRDVEVVLLAAARPEKSVAELVDRVVVTEQPHHGMCASDFLRAVQQETEADGSGFVLFHALDGGISLPDRISFQLSVLLPRLSNKSYVPAVACERTFETAEQRRLAEQLRPHNREMDRLCGRVGGQEGLWELALFQRAYVLSSLRKQQLSSAAAAVLSLAAATRAFADVGDGSTLSVVPAGLYAHQVRLAQVFPAF